MCRQPTDSVALTTLLLKTSEISYACVPLLVNITIFIIKTFISIKIYSTALNLELTPIHNFAVEGPSELREIEDCNDMPTIHGVGVLSVFKCCAAPVVRKG